MKGTYLFCQQMKSHLVMMNKVLSAYYSVISLCFSLVPLSIPVNLEQIQISSQASECKLITWRGQGRHFFLSTYNTAQEIRGLYNNVYISTFYGVCSYFFLSSFWEPVTLVFFLLQQVLHDFFFKHSCKLILVFLYEIQRADELHVVRLCFCLVAKYHRLAIEQATLL